MYITFTYSVLSNINIEVMSDTEQGEILCTLHSHIQYLVI